jgi:hypothetical protein
MLSHDLAQRSQQVAQHSSIGPASGLWREQSTAHDLQHSAQSTQYWADLACFSLPSPASDRQCEKHSLQVRAHWPQVLAHFVMWAECCPASVVAWSATMAIIRKDIMGSFSWETSVFFSGPSTVPAGNDK